MNVPLNALPIDRLAMAHVVLCHHQIAKLRQVIGKGIIPRDMLCNSMDNLHDGLRFPLRAPFAAENPSCSTGIKPEFFFHRLSQ